MSQTFRRDGDREERILASIRGHHLYEKARACMPEDMRETVCPAALYQCTHTHAHAHVHAHAHAHTQWDAAFTQ